MADAELERLRPVRPEPVPAGPQGVGDSVGDSDSDGVGDGPESTGVVGAVRAVVDSVLSAVRRAGHLSVNGLSDVVDGPCRALTGKVVDRAVTRPRPVADPQALAEALAERQGSPVLGGATAAALAAKLARRLGPLRFLARRTPMWLVAAVGPALHASITRGGEELSLVASHLVLRARAAGEEPDPERVRRTAVQVLSGEAIDADAEPRHGPLVVAWVQRGVRATLPFTDGVATNNPRGLASAAAAVAPSELRWRPVAAGTTVPDDPAR